MVQIVYVASPVSQQIHVWKLDEQHGILKLIQVVSTLGNVQPMAVHPNKRFMYVGIRPDFRIITYSISHTGLLNKVAITKIFSSPTHLSCDIGGKFLYCTSYQYNTISILPINNMSVVDSPIQIIEGLLGVHSANLIDVSNEKLLWVLCLREHVIRLFYTNKTGLLSPWTPDIIQTRIGSGPRHMAFFVDNYVYIINELNSTIDVIRYNYTKKKFNIIQTLNIIPDNLIQNNVKCWAADVHITSDGKWLYCSERNYNIITCFSISCKTKELKFVRSQSTEIQPRGFAIDEKNEFLIVAGQKSNYISLYHIDKNTGKLIMLSRHQVGISPMWIEIILLT